MRRAPLRAMPGLLLLIVGATSNCRPDGNWQKATTGGWAPVSQSNSQLGALNGQRQARSLGAQRAGGRFRR